MHSAIYLIFDFYHISYGNKMYWANILLSSCGCLWKLYQHCAMIPLPSYKLKTKQATRARAIILLVMGLSIF